MADTSANFRLTATDRTRGAFNSVQKNLKQTQALQGSWNRGLNANRRAVQQFGFQMTDFATQVAGGQSAMLAFTQQGGQMLQFFGPFGAIAAAFLAVFGSLAIAFTRSGKALSDLMPIMGVLREDFAALGRGLTVVKELMIDFANILVNNMDRILITAATVVGFFAGKWVIAFVAAKVATMTLSGALLLLRGALIRTGIGALIVAAGELVYQFTRLVKAAGGFGNALDLLADVAKEVFDRIVLSFDLVPLGIKAGANLMAKWFTEKVAGMLATFHDFVQSVADGLNGLFGTNLTVAKGLGDAVFELTELRDGFQKTADAAKAEMGAINDAVTAPLTSVQKLKDVMSSLSDDRIDVRDWFGGGKPDEDGGGGAGKDAKDIADKLTEQAKRVKQAYDDMVSSVKTGLSDTFKSLFDETKSFTDTVKGFLGSIMDKVMDMILDPIWDKLANTISTALIGKPGGPGNASLVGGIFSGLVGNFEGGGYTGQGSRSGGLDGKGGRLAMVHPNETITDHTRANLGASEGPSGTITIRLSEGLKAEMTGEMRGIAIQTVDSKSVDIVQQSVNATYDRAREVPIG